MVAAVVSGVPVLVLKEGTQRWTKEDARRMNILAARVVAETIKTTLGPRGMDKLLVDSLGDVTISNDGRVILDEIDVQHPAAKIMVELAKAQDNVAGDGTTTAVILAGELLAKAQELLRKNIHPSIIIEGWRKAADKCEELLKEISKKISADDVETLKKIATTAMHSKAVAGERDYLAELAVKAVKAITEKRGEKLRADIDNIKILKKPGKSLKETEFITGIVLDKEVVHPGMPKRVENARIALLKCPLEIQKTEFSEEIRITSPEQMKAFIDQETKLLEEMVIKIKEVGANVVFCQKGIDDVAQHFLAREGILAVRRVSSSDMEKLARATGGKIVTNLDDLSPEDLGEAEVVEERKVGGDKMVFVMGCKNPRSVTILVRGGAERIVDEAERAIHDALCVVRDAVEDGAILPGAGAVEIELAEKLREYAKTVGGKEQYAIEAFADAIEAIPRTLAENAGLDAMDILAKLREAHEKGNQYAGVDVFDGNIKDMLREGIIEPIRVKLHAIKAATETAQLILRIDDVIAAKPFEKEKEKEEKGKEEEEFKSEEF